MDEFNYDDRKYLELDTEDLKRNKNKVEWIYTNYENIKLDIQNHSETAPLLLINGYRIAKLKTIPLQTQLNDLKAEFNFDQCDYLRVTYKEH
ncbi:MULTISPECIES: hypothetical protein [Staphylococcus]|uniref:Uncharacterized protein n=1 Tax=Staphylococcus saprophyticus TaxID=29385 RepID=A0A380HPT1_STASA|nr:MULTISPECIES: hypothetical protein [Staphylococcus]KIJ87301.1 hypothetical protein SE00_03820 [Staphylococcus saprophyticus]MBF2752355.1 hypothetical protein [Staphylococcus saprophyticus]MBF2778807.1 hypothetical protein [Staphylococcus saprophyticus]MBF2781110.1 hypothetical protein [Staphylococcus saprophyticus]MBN6092071.1 hypothetical protein [Staphylococcus saprophyticus]